MKVYLPQLLCAFFLILFSRTSVSQEDYSPKEWFVEAESYFLFEEYKDAVPLYQRILRDEPDNFNVKYKIGICYLNDPYQKEKSIKYLAEAAENINVNYKTNSYKEKLAPPEVNYYLGQAYRINGNLNKALEFYAEFKRNMDQEIFDLNVVNDEIAACQMAKQLILKPVYVKENNIGEEINSRFADINPIMSGDGKTIAFTRIMQFYDGVFVSKKDEQGNWSPPYNLTPDFTVDGSSYCTGLSYSGDEIFVYRSDNFDGNIYSSKFKNDRWEPLQKLNDFINTKYWESHASPSPDGKYLYFTSNRKGGYGGLDIYKSLRKANGDWSEPVNLGPIVNSSYNEETPFVSNDNKLFFSSLGHSTMGGYDIFVTELVGPETWARPVNMGYPVNTTDDDLFFAPVPGNEYTGIYSFYNEANTYGLKDIFLVKVFNSVLPRTFTIKGDLKTPEPDLLTNGEIKISIIDNQAGKIIQQVEPNADGSFSLNAPQGSYQLLIDGVGLKPVSQPLELSLNQEEELIDLQTISTQLAEVGEENLIKATTIPPKIEIVGKEYIITDSVPVNINLILAKGNDLIIESFVNGKKTNHEEYRISKENFTYVFNPKPGDNKLVFTTVDKNKNISTQEMTVFYEPEVIKEPVAELGEEEKVSEQMSGIALITNSVKLQNYLESLESLKYKNLLELYEMLSVNADENDFSKEEINQLFAIMLSQRNKSEFIESTNSVNGLSAFSTNDSVVKQSDIPLIIIKNLKPEVEDEQVKFYNGLNSIINGNINNAEDKLKYLLSFSDKDLTEDEIQALSLLSGEELYKELSKTFGADITAEMIEKAASTQELKQFYFNLLMSANGTLLDILNNLNMEEKNISNSIELVDYLFMQAESGVISEAELIQQIEEAKKNESQNIRFFHEALANAATGELKTGLNEISPNQKSINGIIDELLKNAQSKGYGRTEVYNLLLKMIGIQNVDEFIEKMQHFSKGDIDSLLSTLKREHYSLPVEIIQYLLSESAYFDYTESDINDLLIRMLLEKGIDKWETTGTASESEKIIKRNRYITTLILANVFIIILFILFWRRRKKNKE
ncbi:MAG: PD40 domain-containing protein [Bacteroidales bacterium]|nr:PD40 domain-containing protein [Bacteroidales bacterium]MBN2818456.1 PD40 domain-containing protein [Bacteroidales bacterium]